MERKVKIRTFVLALLMGCAGCKSDSGETQVNIIPAPVSIQYEGKSLVIDNGVSITSRDTVLYSACSWLAGEMQKLPEAQLLRPERNADVEIRLSLDDQLEQPEGYILQIGRKITVSGKTKEGVLHGLQSLLQILYQTPSSEGAVRLPRLTVTDYPRFPYRGMLLDVSRHFFGVDFVKKYIDLIAMHKMNVFHWHLTDDQGWRIEIRKYPELTAVGAWRADHEDLPWGARPDQWPNDTARYGGFYTQDQIREVVSYAAERGITVIPEIEMPGHSAAAIASYPELSCRGEKIPVPSGGAVQNNILCAGKEQTFTFIEDVLTEVMELFPSKYIHIGGDEAQKKEWENCPLCQKRIKDEDLADEGELQSYFIGRVDSFLTARGRTLIGWDEILEGGLAENATVMSWRGEAGGVKAARMKHDVVMTPVDYCYFDYYQSDDKDLEPLAFNGQVTLEKVYASEPVPGELGPQEARHILGAQGNLWTEFVTTGSLAEFRVLPRMSALSEVVWSPRESRNYDDFMKRLGTFLEWLTGKNYNFFIPAPQGILEEMIFIDSSQAEMKNPWPFAMIRYTLDGSVPNVNSAIYEKPFPVRDKTVLKASLFLKNGQQGPVKTARFRQVEPIPPYAVDSTRLRPGLRFNYYEVAVSSVGAIKKYSPRQKGVLGQVSLPPGRRQEVFAVEFIGYLNVPQSDVYSFALTSDDGSCFYLGENLVINHDGFHGPSTAWGQVALQKGFYPVYVGYFDGGGGNSLKLEVKTHVGEWKQIPPQYFFHEPER